MTTHLTDSDLRIYARIAGLLYLVIIVCGISSEVLIRFRLIIMEDAAVTAGNILASEPLFRAGFAADTVMLLADVAVAVIFYVLFKPAGKTLALTAAAFRMTQAAVLGLNLLNYYAAILLLKGGVFSVSFEAGQVNSLALLFLDLHRHGYDLGLLFFGVSTLVLGVLVIKSNLIPALMGYGLIAAGMVYLSGGYTRFLFPNYLTYIEPFYIIPLIVEISFCLWLLLKGVKLAAH